MAVLPALLLAPSAFAAPVCDPTRLPRPQTVAFSASGVAVKLDMQAVCEGSAWAITIGGALRVVEADALIPDLRHPFDEVSYSAVIGTGLGGGGTSSIGRGAVAREGEGGEFSALTLGTLDAEGRLEVHAGFAIAPAAGEPRSQVSIEGRLDTRRARPRMRTTVTVRAATYVAGQDLRCPRGAVLAGADPATGVTRCLELGRDVRVVDRLPLEPDEHRGLRCPDKAVLVALTGDAPCVSLSVDDGPSAWSHAISPHTISSALVGWPGPLVAACPNETVATSFDLDDPELLRCEAPNELLVAERRIRP